MNFLNNFFILLIGSGLAFGLQLVTELDFINEIKILEKCDVCFRKDFVSIDNRFEPNKLLFWFKGFSDLKLCLKIWEDFLVLHVGEEHQTHAKGVESFGSIGEFFFVPKFENESSFLEPLVVESVGGEKAAVGDLENAIELDVDFDLSFCVEELKEEA